MLSITSLAVIHQEGAQWHPVQGAWAWWRSWHAALSRFPNWWRLRFQGRDFGTSRVHGTRWRAWIWTLEPCVVVFAVYVICYSPSSFSDSRARVCLFTSTFSSPYHCWGTVKPESTWPRLTLAGVRALLPSRHLCSRWHRHSLRENECSVTADNDSLSLCESSLTSVRQNHVTHGGLAGNISGVWQTGCVFFRLE